MTKKEDEEEKDVGYEVYRGLEIHKYGVDPGPKNGRDTSDFFEALLYMILVVWIIKLF